MTGVGKQQRVTIGGRARHQFRADVPGRPRAVVDHDLLAKQRREFGRHYACHAITTTASG